MNLLNMAAPKFIEEILKFGMKDLIRKEDVWMEDKVLVYLFKKANMKTSETVEVTVCLYNFKIHD